MVFRFECPCIVNPLFSNADYFNLVTSYRNEMHKMVDAGEFEKDDFTVVIQTFAEDTEEPPLLVSDSPEFVMKLTL